MHDHSASTLGTLYVVATPIGNLDDLSARAIKTLQEVDAILAEDTRHTGQLCHALGIHKPLISLHAHNEHEKLHPVLEKLKTGVSLALVSDAGTPLISDPGFILVREAREQGVPIVPIPGPCALITALSVAGIPSDSFTFIGFLPHKSSARQKKLQDFISHEHTLIFYESTHRLLDCLQDIALIYGEEHVFVVAKELTKSFETIIQGNTSAILDWFQEEPARIKGEFVVLLPPLSNSQEEEAGLKELKVLLTELPLKQAVKIASQLTGVNKNELYKKALLIVK